jgi:hypothetical protein
MMYLLMAQTQQQVPENMPSMAPLSLAVFLMALLTSHQLTHIFSQASSILLNRLVQRLDAMVLAVMLRVTM